MNFSLDKTSSTPLYEQLADHLKNMISSSELVPGQLMPSENLLAQAYSISRMTARATLRLLEDEGHVVCNGKKGRIVGKGNGAMLLLPDSANWTVGLYPFIPYHYHDTAYFSRIIEGMSEGALKNHVRLKFLPREPFTSGNEELLQYLRERKIDALLRLRSNDLDLDEIRYLEANGIKTILFNAAPDSKEFSFITCDHYHGSAMLMDCLCNMGHQEIAIAMLPRSIDPYVNQARWQAYRDAHDRYKINYSDSRVIEIASFGSSPGCEDELRGKLVEMLGRQSRRPSAIFISRGAFAATTLSVISELNLKVPEDISVVCFDSMQLPPPLPRLTCVDQPVEKMASMAIDALVKKLTSPSLGSSQIRLAPEFIPGNSCAFHQISNRQTGKFTS